MLVEAFVAELAIETFDVGILHGLAWPNERQGDSCLIGPGIQRPAGKLRLVVHGDGSRQATHFCQPFKHVGNPQSRQRRINLDGQAFASVVIDNIQAAEPATIGQTVGDKVH